MQIDRPISIAVILFATLLLAFFLVIPEYNNFKALQLDLGKKIAEYEAKFDYYTAISKTYNELQEHKEDIKKVDDALPENPAFGGVVYFLQQAAKDNGLIVKNLFLSKLSSNNNDQIASAESNNAKVVKDIIFSLDLLGNYPSLQNFIVSLEKSSRIFEVTNISFVSSSPSKPGSVAKKSSQQAQLQTQQSVNFSIQIKTHSY